MGWRVQVWWGGLIGSLFLGINMKIGGRGYSSHSRWRYGGCERWRMWGYLEGGRGFVCLTMVGNGICCLTRKRECVAEHPGSIGGA